MENELHPFYVGGEWRTAGSGAETINPFDGARQGMYALAGAEGAEEAVRKGLEGFSETRELTSFDRSEILFRIADGIQTRKDVLAESITREVGKAIQFSRIEVDRAISTFRIAGEEAKRIGGETLSLDLLPASSGRFGLVRRFPVGIVLAVCPFNYPLNLAAHKIGPAIAAGNTVLFKPAPQAPGTALELTRIIEASGFPRKAFSTLPCPNEVAERLVTDDRIAMLSFTGSAAVGWKLKSLAGKKKVLLELGGNAGVIIDESADIDDAVRKNVMGAFVYSGQVCIKVQRIFVHEKLFDSYVQKFVAATKAIKCGDPMSGETVVGPLIDDAAADRVERWISEAVRSGARVLTGGIRKGRIIEPAVLLHAGRTSEVYCNEVFGPVVTLQPFKNFAEAIDLVNDTRYGLQAGVFSNNHQNILRAYEKIQTGAVIVNDNPTYRMDHMPYGGIKDSGLGREGVKYAIEAMTEPKLLVLRSS
jgi:glyceraldehyde-3-phosphate dehydrogenase (NADP+)